MIFFSENSKIDLDAKLLADIEEPEGTNEGYTPDYEGAMLIIAESNADWGILSEALAYGDIIELRESFVNPDGVQYVQEANIKGMFEAVKNFFKKIWARIKEFFANFMAQVNRFLMSEKAFIEKYEKAFMRANSVEIKMHTWGNFSNIVGNVEKLVKDSTVQMARVKDVITRNRATGSHKNQTEKEVEEIQKARKKINDDYNNDLDLERGKILNNDSTKIKASEFNKAIKFTMRNDGKFTTSDPGKDTTTNVNRSFIVTELKAAKSTRESIDKLRKNADKFYKEILKGIQEQENELNKTVNSDDNDASRIASARIGLCSASHRLAKGQASVYNSFCGGLCSALRERNAEYKSIVVQTIRLSARNERKAQNNSYNIYEDFDVENMADVDDFDERNHSNLRNISTNESAVSNYLASQGY